jgi:hypothetical protein
VSDLRALDVARCFFPLIAGLGDIQSQAVKVLLQFCVAFMIGATFGLLFQRDVRGYGSCMGWGLGYTVFWWFAGPLTLFPLFQRMPLNWSMDASKPIVRTTRRLLLA